MRVCAATTILSAATAFRTNIHEHGKQASQDVQDPGEWSEIPGYRVHADQKCGGSWIEFWGSGDYAFYGQADSAHPYTEPLECARECNQHSECAGFYVKDGNCAHWRQGELQDMTHRQAYGHQCYVKWQAEDLSDVNVGPAPPPPPPPAGAFTGGAQVSDCLCVFDVDRTLTAKQGWYDCPGTEAHNDVPDWAYNGGTLILSEFAKGIRDSHCGSCYMGMVSAGTASGPNSIERGILDGLVDSQYDVGGYVEGCPSPVWGTKVMACGEGIKQRAVDDIITWLGTNGVTINPDRVHFYDDKENNIGGFINSGYHAHQISCASRDGNRGGCGGTAAEISSDSVAPGQSFC